MTDQIILTVDNLKFHREVSKSILRPGTTMSRRNLFRGVSYVHFEVKLH